MKSLTLQIASLPDRKNAVCEIWFGNDQVAEVSQENDGPMSMEIFSAPDGREWEFELDALQAILDKAKNNLHQA